MRHPNTRAITEYWQSLRGGEDSAGRTRLGARQMAGLLDHIFILHRYDAEHAVFRLAGPGLGELYQRDLREQNFMALWRGADRLHIQALLSSSVVAPGPGVAMIRAETIVGDGIAAEVFLAPLVGLDGTVDRFLGLYQPMTGREALGGRPVIRQHVTAVYPPKSAPARAPRAARAQPGADRRRAAGSRAAHLHLIADNTRGGTGQAGRP